MSEIPAGFLCEFAEQDRAREFIWSAISSGRLGSTYMFAGPDGVGKLDFAVKLAQFLNCQDKYDGMPCGVCQSCRNTLSLSHPDVLVIFPMPKSVWENKRDEAYELLKENLYIRPKFETSASIQIEMVREIKRFVSTAPVDKVKLVIVADAHMMNTEASNAFLKVLEEPASYAHIFLTTSSPETLLPTIRSRAQIVRFRRISHDQLMRKLVDSFGVSPDEAEFSARWGDGSITKALLSTSKEFKRIRPEVESLFLNACERKWKDILEWFINCPNKFDQADLILNIMVSFARDAMVLSAGKPDLCINSDLMPTIRQVASTLKLKDLSELFLSLAEKRTELERNPQYRLFWGAIASRFFKTFSEHM